MAYCKVCGVELESDMQACPLCGQPVSSGPGDDKPVPERVEQPPISIRKMDRPQKKLVWEIISIILVSSIAVSLLTDFIITGRITWSQYPVAVCLTAFTYVSLFALWNQRFIVELACACVASSLFLLALDALTGGLGWLAKLGIPALVLGNVLVAALVWVIRLSKHKGINLIAYGFLAAGLFCLGIDGILSYFKTESLHLWWSLIVGTCVLPVALVLFFVHYRLKKGQSLERTFHV